MKLRALIAAAALLLPGALPAQSRVTVPVQDPVYRDLDRLIALRLVEVGLYGQRPYSRREIARIVKETQASVGTREVSRATRQIVERLATRFAAEIRQLEGKKIESTFRLDVAEELGYADREVRGIPPDATGSVDAVIDPLAAGQMGRTVADGWNVGAELRALYERQRVALTAEVRALVAADSAVGELRGASVVFPIRNVTIEAGRQPIVWGQGMDGGLIFSSSGKALDMLRISTDLPFRGWFIKGTSPMRGSIVAADLGGRQHFPHSFLVAYKLSGHPFTNRVELAASVMGVQGGRGAPKGTFVDHAMDLIPIFKYLLPDNTTQFSNKIAGWEYRIRIPEWSGLQLYAEHAFEDMDPRRWASTFWEDGGHIVGASVNDLGPEGALSAAWEFHHTGLRFYKHGVFLSGMTFNGTLFGDPLGNQGNGTYLRLNWDRGGSRTFTTTFAVERRTGDEYRAVSVGPNEDNFHFERMQFFPAEWRTRIDATYNLGRRNAHYSVRGVYERVHNFAFSGQDERNNFLIGVSLNSLIIQRP